MHQTPHPPNTWPTRFISGVRCVFDCGILLPVYWISYMITYSLDRFKKLHFGIQVGILLGLFSGYSLFQLLWVSGVNTPSQTFYWLSLEANLRYYVFWQPDYVLHIPDKESRILPITAYDLLMETNTTLIILAISWKLTLYALSSICCAFMVQNLASKCFLQVWPRKKRKCLPQVPQAPLPAPSEPEVKIVYRDARDRPSPVQAELITLHPVDLEHMIKHLRHGLPSPLPPNDKD